MIMENPITSENRMRLAVFATGGGTGFQAIAEAARRGDLPATVALLLSNRAGAGAVHRAKNLEIPTAVLAPSDFEVESAYAQRLTDLLAAHGITFVALAGYLKKIPPPLVEAFRGRMANIHPALLPAFGGRGMYGRRVHEAVLDYGARWTGATVHLVDDTYDTGPVVAQVPVPVCPGDTPDRLAARVQEAEHRLYPAVLRCFAEGRVHVDGRRVRIDGKRPDAFWEKPLE